MGRPRKRTATPLLNCGQAYDVGKVKRFRKNCPDQLCTGGGPHKTRFYDLDFRRGKRGKERGDEAELGEILFMKEREEIGCWGVVEGGNAKKLDKNYSKSWERHRKKGYHSTSGQAQYTRTNLGAMDNEYSQKVRRV